VIKTRILASQELFNVQSSTFKVLRHLARWRAPLLDSAIRRRQKFSQLPIPFDYMAVSIDNRKRSFHVRSSRIFYAKKTKWALYRSSTTSLSRPST
jgi:hypothetical protein